MSKLKKNIGIGAVIIALFLALITVINQPTPVLSQTVQIARGKTPVGNTAWRQYFVDGIFVDVDTSLAGFKTTPIYISSLGGESHWGIIGATSIYDPTPTGFRVYVRYATGGSLTPAEANQNRWHINWIAVPEEM
jgi:hypothetical protein